MIPLKIPFRRAHLVAFWIVIGLVMAVFVAVVAALLGVRAWWLFGAAAGLLAGAPGFMSSRGCERGLRAWNKGSRMLTALLRTLAMKIGFYLILVPLRGSGRNFRMAPASGSCSMWVPRETPSGQIKTVQSLPGRGAWLSDLNRFREEKGHRWMIALVPFLLTLNALGDEQEDTAPSTRTYTLY
jgi:hypothetical protein